MELTEPIQAINKRLKQQFGIDTASSNPMFRIVWSDDQYEKRLSEFTPEGLQLIIPQVIETRKYSYIKERFVLERLVAIPEYQSRELAGLKVSYEPLWTFEDKKGNYLPPKWEACELVIDIFYTSLGKKQIYKDDSVSPEAKEAQLKKMYEDLFGNETDVTDALAYREAIVVPGNGELK